MTLLKRKNLILILILNPVFAQACEQSFSQVFQGWTLVSLPFLAGLMSFVIFRKLYQLEFFKRIKGLSFLFAIISFLVVGSLTLPSGIKIITVKCEPISTPATDSH
jgi:hypothetical protein